LLFRRLQLDVGNQLHSSIMERLVLGVKSFRALARTPIHPRPKGRGISEKI
jgi:hypothetical protein